MPTGIVTIWSYDMQKELPRLSFLFQAAQCFALGNVNRVFRKSKGERKFSERKLKGGFFSFLFLMQELY